MQEEMYEMTMGDLPKTEEETNHFETRDDEDNGTIMVQVVDID